MKHTLQLAIPLFIAMGIGFAASGAATSTLGSVNAVAAAAVCRSAVKVPVYGFDIVVSGTTPNPNLTGFNFTTTGTYTTTDINKFQLWYSTTNNFATATQLSTNITATLGTGTHTFAAFTQALTTGTTYYFWISTDATAAAVYNHTLSVSALATANITVSAGTKAGTSASGTAQTFSTPVITITPASVTRCANDTGNILTASGATTYSWLPASALAATTGTYVSTTAAATTIYTVTGTLGSCTSAATATVTVNANPTIVVSNAGPVCNAAITASGASTYAWSPASGLTITTGAAVSPVPTVTTTYTVTGTTTAGCSGTGITTILATPSAVITSSAVCTSGMLAATASVSGYTISGYSWLPAAGLSTTSGDSVTAAPATLTTYSVIATASNGCTGNATVTAGMPMVAVTPAAADGCTGAGQTYTATGAAAYVWSPATYLSATTGTAVTATPTVSGSMVYTVTGTDTRGCVNYATAVSGTGTIALLPYSEGFESYTNTVSCNELMGPSLSTGSGREGSGTALNVQNSAADAPGYTSSTVQIPAHSGTSLAGFGFHANNDYFVTPGFTLAAGNTYQFSFWYRIDGGLTYTDDYNANMFYNTTPSLAGATDFTTFSTEVLPGANAAQTTGNLVAMINATYQRWTGYFTPVTSGTYYFGINALNNNLTNTFYWGFDDVAFRQASPCVSPAAAASFSCSPSSGSTTNLTITSTADSFICVALAASAGTPTATPVNGVNYTVGGSLGGGIIIAKGISSGINAASSGYFAPGSAYNFYVYTYQHDTCNGVAYSTSYTTTSSSPSFYTCPDTTPSAPVIAAMLPGGPGTASITLSGLPASGTVVVNAYTNAAGTIPASTPAYTVTADSSSLTISDASVYTGAHLWYTVSQTVGGCTVTSFVSQQASIPAALPWNQNFETASADNLMSPNYMQANLGLYTDQTSTVYGAEDNHGSTYVTPHSGSWDFLFFGGVTTTTAAPGTGAPYIPLAVYTDQWLETPGLYCPQAGTYKLSFWCDNPSGSFPSISIQYSNIPGLPSNSSSAMTSATMVGTVAPTTGGGWHQYTMAITIPSGPQTIFVGFDVAAASSSGYMAFDDIEVCEVPTVTVTNSSFAGTVCHSGTLSLSAATTPSSGVTSGPWNYTWSGAGTISSTAGNATVSGLASVDFNPVYSVSVINTHDTFNMCGSAAATTTATITPTPTAVTGAASLCGGAGALYTGGSTFGTPGWSITGPGAAYLSGAVTSGYSVTTANPASQQTVTINYANGCGTATPKTININVQPVAITAADFVSAPAAGLCISHSVTVTDNTSGGVWSNTPTAEGTINAATGVFSASTTTGTTTISYTMSTGGCSVATTLAVGNAGPGAITGGAASVCVGAVSPAFACTPAGGIWSISPTSYANISASAVVTGIANTNGTPATITYNTGCGTAATRTVTVNGTTGSLTGPATVCTGSAISLSSSGLTPSTGVTYSWAGPSSFASTVANPTISAATIGANGIYTLTAAQGGCSNTYAELATVAEVPSAVTLTAANPVLCSGSATSLTSALAAETAQVFGIPVYTPTFVVTGILNSSSTWTSGSASSGYLSLVLPFSFSFYGNTYSTIYIGTNGYITFGSGSSLSATTAITAGTPGNVVALFQNSLTLAASGSIQYGVTGTAPYRQFIIYYNAVPGTATGGPNTGYIVLNESTNVIDLITDAFRPNTGGKATCGIASAAGAGGISPAGRNNAAYTITTPEAWRFYSLNNYKYSWAPAASVVSSSIASPATPALSTTTVYTLTVSDDILPGCTSANTYTVTVDTSAAANTSNTQACIGATSVNMPFSSATGSPSVYSISWTSGAIDAGFANVTNASFPGGTSGNIPVAIGGGATPGSGYAGTITFNNGGNCPTSNSFTMSVKAQPSLNLAALSLSPSYPVMCEGLIVDFSVAGATGGASPYVYTWQGPGITGTTTSPGSTMVYTLNTAATGMYSVTLSSSSTGCNTTPVLTTASAYTVLSTPAPTVSGVAASPMSLCAASTLSLSATSPSGGSMYTWTGPDSYSATGTSPSVSFSPATTAASGVYSVVLTSTVTSCSSNAAVTGGPVTVNALPSGGTIAGVYTVCPGATTAFSVTGSVGAGTWSSSNASIASVSATGAVTGVASGTANISYTATNSCGTAYAYSVITVSPLPSAGIISGTYSVCPASATALSNTGSVGTTSWSSSNTSIATVNAGGVVTGIAAGTATISYSAANSCGSVATYSAVTVNPLPSPAGITGTYSVCQAGTAALSDATAGGVWSSSNTAVATVNGSGTVAGIAAGTASISYAVTNGCGTTAASAAVTVHPMPLPGVINGIYTVCPGSTTTLSDTTSGGTWSSSAPSVASVSTSGIVTGISAGTAPIVYSMTNSCGTVTSSQSVTVHSLPSAGSVTGTFSLCATGTTVLSDAVSGGTWASAAPAVATISTTGIVSGVAAGTAPISYSYSNGCGTAVTTQTVTVSGVPNPGIIGGPAAACTGTTATLTETVAGGLWSSSADSVATVSTTGVVTGVAAGSANITYTKTTSCGSAHTSTMVTITNQGMWLGTGSASWTDAGNWPCGAIPDSTVNVIIPEGTTYTPSITANAYTKALTIASGASLAIGSSGTINIKGQFSDSGSITGTGAVVMNGNTAQVIQGTSYIGALTINNPAGVSVNAGDTLEIKGTLTLTNGTLTTNNGIELCSDATGTARIGAITGGAITGNVIIQQYITGGRRAFRFWAHPFSTAIPLSGIEKWIDITGTGGSANGFTTTITNAASSFWYNTATGNSSMSVDPGWTAFTNTNGAGANAFNPYEGIRLFIRGSKGEGLTAATYVPSAATINMAGPVNTGAITETMVKGTGAYEDYNLLGNPYPSPVDIGTVIENAQTAGQVTGSAFYVWNPYLSTSGQFVAVPIGSPYYIEANSSFEVRTAANGNALNFAETNKSASITSVLLRNSAPEHITLNIYDTAYHLWDIWNLNFSDAATDNDDARYDADKPSSPAPLNFYSISADGNKLAIDARPYAAGKIIPLGFSSSYMQTFIVSAGDMIIPQGEQVYLHDKYLQRYTVLQQGTEYKFAVNTDAASQGNNRFELAIDPAGITAVKTPVAADVQMTPNPATSNVTITYFAPAKAHTMVSVTDATGVTVAAEDLGIQQSGRIDIALDRLAPGVYFVAFISGTEKIVRRLVKE